MQLYVSGVMLYSNSLKGRPLQLMNKEIPRDPLSDDENSNRKVNFGNRYRRSKSPNRFALLAVDEADAEADVLPILWIVLFLAL